jgi:hypothetical protein
LSEDKPGLIAFIGRERRPPAPKSSVETFSGVDRRWPAAADVDSRHQQKDLFAGRTRAVRLAAASVE